MAAGQNDLRTWSGAIRRRIRNGQKRPRIAALQRDNSAGIVQLYYTLAAAAATSVGIWGGPGRLAKKPQKTAREFDSAEAAT